MVCVGDASHVHFVADPRESNMISPAVADESMQNAYKCRRNVAQHELNLAKPKGSRESAFSTMVAESGEYLGAKEVVADLSSIELGASSLEITDIAQAFPKSFTWLVDQGAIDKSSVLQMIQSGQLAQTTVNYMISQKVIPASYAGMGPH